MTGPEHYAEAERLLALADRHTRGVTYAQEWTLTLTAAQVHATRRDSRRRGRPRSSRMG